jgi:hypothetical protein
MTDRVILATRRLVLALLPLVALGQAPSPQGPTGELTAEELTRRHVEALGGRAKLAATLGVKKTGIYAYNGLEHPLVSYHEPSGRCREEIEGLRLWATSVWEGHTVLRGTNGRLAWILDESRDPQWRAISPARAALMLEEADLFGALVDAAEKGHQIELLGPGEVDGTPTHRLRVALASGIVMTWHLDQSSYLVLRKEVEADPTREPARELERPRAWQYDDYRPVNGVLLPFWVYVEEALFSREYLFDTIETGIEIDDALFEPPPGAITQGPG